MTGAALCLLLLQQPGDLSEREVAAACSYADTLVDAAESTGVPVERLICVAHRETKWTDLIGSSGECGVTQVLPSAKYTCKWLRNPDNALRRTASLLSVRNTWHRLASRGCTTKSCSTQRTLMGYNAGTAAAKGRGKKLRRATAYANAVLTCERSVMQAAFHKEVPLSEIRIRDLIRYYSVKGGYQLGHVTGINGDKVSAVKNGTNRVEKVSMRKVLNVWRDLFSEKEHI